MKMGSSGNLGLALVLLTMSWAGAMAQSGCTNVLIGMAPCLNYVSGSSTSPSSSCCSSLDSVVKSQPRCLCTALDGSAMAALGININKTLALALPSACKVETPPVSRCEARNNAPAIAPVASPNGLPYDSSHGPSGSKQVTGNAATYDGTKMQQKLLAFILFMLALIDCKLVGVF